MLSAGSKPGRGNRPERMHEWVPNQWPARYEEFNWLENFKTFVVTFVREVIKKKNGKKACPLFSRFFFITSLTFIPQLLAWYIQYQHIYSTVTCSPNCWQHISNTTIYFYKCPRVRATFVWIVLFPCHIQWYDIIPPWLGKNIRTACDTRATHRPEGP